MKRFAFLGCQILLLVIFSNTSFAQKPYEIKDLDVLLMYYKLSGEEIPWKDVAQNYPEYQKAKDEFARQDVLDKLKPKIQEEMNSLIQKKPLTIVTRFKIEEYDFDKQAFLLGLTDSTYFAYKSSSGRLIEDLGITFTNMEKFAYWPVTREEAHKIIQRIGDSREVIAVIEIIPINASIGKINFNYMGGYTKARTVQAEVSKITFELLNRSSIVGTVLANDIK